MWWVGRDVNRDYREGVDSSSLGAPQFWREIWFRRCRRERSPLHRLISISCPLSPLGLEIILSMERSTEWSPLLNSHDVPHMWINVLSLPGYNSIKKWLYASRQPQFFRLISSSSISLLFLSKGRKYSCVVHKHFWVKTSDGLLALKIWKRFGNPIMVRVCSPIIVFSDQ